MLEFCRNFAGARNKKTQSPLSDWISRVFWSGRSDSNTPPLAPHASFPKPTQTTNYLIFKDLATDKIDFDWCKLTKICDFDNAKTRLPEEFCSS